MSQIIYVKHTPTGFFASRLFLVVSFFTMYPVGTIKMWKGGSALWKKLAYTILGLPVFLFLYSFIAIVVFAWFLPPLDMSVGDHLDRTIRNNAGNYESTFLKTGRETDGAYEWVQVEVEQKGGNDLHYHKTFEEHFTVIKGELTVDLKGRKVVLKPGESFTVPKNTLHSFHNMTDSITLMQVRVRPARGLEKSIRVAYGLGNSGMWDEGMFPDNPWHLFLLLGYSETYLPDLPGFIQEPLVNALAKVAQWRGEDQSLEVFFR